MHFLDDDAMHQLCDSLAYDPDQTDEANEHAVQRIAERITQCMGPHYVSNLKCPITRWVARFMHEVADTGKLNALGCGDGEGATKAKTMIVTVVTRSHLVAQETCSFHHAHFVRARKAPSKPYQWYLLGLLEPTDFRISRANVLQSNVVESNILEIDTKESFHLLVSYKLQSIALRVTVAGTCDGSCGLLWARPAKMDIDLSFLIAALAERFPEAKVKDAQFVDAGFIAWLMDWQSWRLATMPDDHFKSQLEKFARIAPEMRDDFAAFVEFGGGSDTASSRHVSTLDPPATVVRPSGRNNLPLSLQPLAILANQARQVRWWPWHPCSGDGPVPFHCWSIANFDARLVIHATEFSEFKQFSIQANQQTQDDNGCVYEKPYTWSNMNIDGDGLLKDHFATWHCDYMSVSLPDDPDRKIYPPLESFVVDARGEFLLCLSTPQAALARFGLAWPEVPESFTLFWVPIAELVQQVNAKGKDFVGTYFKLFHPASVRIPSKALLSATGLIEDARKYSLSSMLLTAVENMSLPSRLSVTMILEHDPMTGELEWYVHRGRDEDKGASSEQRQLQQVQQRQKFARKLAEKRRSLELMRVRIDRSIEQHQREEREKAKLMHERLVQRLSKRTVEAAIANLPVWQEARERMTRIRGLQKPQLAESVAERAERQRWLREEAAADKQVKEAFKQLGRECDKVQADMAAAARTRHKATLQAARRERRAMRAAVRLVEVAEEQRAERERAALRAWHKEQEQAVRRRRRIAKARAAAQQREAEAIERAARRAQKNALRQQRRAFRRLERGQPSEPEPAADGDNSDNDELPPLPAHLRIPPPSEPQLELKAPPSPATSTAPPSYPSTAVREQECDICFEPDPTWGRLNCGHMYCVDCGKKLADCPKCGKATMGLPLVCFF